jgi:hypothetical protein
MEVVLPADMTVKDSHDISLDLQHKVRRTCTFLRQTAVYVAVIYCISSRHDISLDLQHKMQRTCTFLRQTAVYVAVIYCISSRHDISLDLQHKVRRTCIYGICVSPLVSGHHILSYVVFLLHKRQP